MHIGGIGLLASVRSAAPMTEAMLVVGATGAIGAEVSSALTRRGHRVVRTSRDHDAPFVRLDLAADPASWRLENRFAAALLVAAQTGIAACEADPAGTRRINVEGMLRLAERLAAGGAFLVYVSTNLVLSDEHPRAAPDEPFAPRCEYARQKAEVEQALRTLTPRVAIVRITKIVEGLEPLVQRWARALLRHEEVAAFTDLVCAPMPLATLVAVLVAIAEDAIAGIHQIGADRDVPYVEIARRLAARLGAPDALVRATTSREAGVHLPALPSNTTLDTSDSDRRFALAPIRSDEVIDALIETVVAKVRAVGS